MSRLVVLKAHQWPSTAQETAGGGAQHPCSEAGAWMTGSEIARLCAEARAEGFARGRSQGLTELSARLREQLARESEQLLAQQLEAREREFSQARAAQWQSLAKAWDLQIAALRQAVEAEMTALVSLAVVRLLGLHAPQLVSSAVRAVLADAGVTGAATILLHPSDHAALMAEGSVWSAELKFAASDAVALSGCIVQTPIQTLDARVEVQLELLRAALDEARAAAKGAPSGEPSAGFEDA